MYIYRKTILITIFLSIVPSITFAITPEPSNSVVTLTVDNTPTEYITLTDISEFTQKMPFLTYDPHYSTEIEKNVLCNNTYEPCLLTSSTRQSFTLNNETSVIINKEKIETFVDDISRKVNIDFNNAKLKFDETTNTLTELTPHTDGISVDVEKTVEKITNFLKNNSNIDTIELDYTKTPAKITSKNAKSLGIKELIGEGVSDFRGSTKSRIHNIATASKRFDGLVIPPDEEFSFVSILGPVDGEHGYKEELVIRDNETKPEYGGGICQVSTTVFRGAIYSGMKITQRRNHSYPVSYYTPTGFDATVYIPAPDFKFVNNTPGHILLNVEMEGTKLIFKYYGTNDEREVEMKGPYVTERQSNGAMKTYFTQTVKNKDGDIIIDDTFKSNYKSPDDYPHPGDVAKLTKKPDNWSKSQWSDYKKQNGL